MANSSNLINGRASFPLVGVSFCADEVSRLIADQPLQVIPEPHNPFDANALRVVTLQGLSVGYVPKALAAALTTDHPGRAFRAQVTQLRYHDGVVVGADIQLATTPT